MDELMSRPIFVHASPRSGSTYVFNVLRRMGELIAFNEAINDVFSYYGKVTLRRFRQGQKWNVNHQFLDRDDFHEFVEAWDEVMGLYPAFPSFRDYLPVGGQIRRDLREYLDGLICYARRKGRRAALCEIHSRGRAGALRAAFGGFHVAQFRDPISQFGSFFRALDEGGQWNYLVFPLMELGLTGDHLLYQVVPERWRVPLLPWPERDRAQRWASSIRYISVVASTESGALERNFRWHIFSWFLSTLASVSYSDCLLDIDKLHDDPAYRRSISGALGGEIGAEPDFSDLSNFRRYYEFEGVDISAICDEVVASVRSAVADGRLGRSIASLGSDPRKIDVRESVDLLEAKLVESLDRFRTTQDRRRVGVEDWNSLVHQHRMIWCKPAIRMVAQRMYPLGAPVARLARLIGVWK